MTHPDKLQVTTLVLDPSNLVNPHDKVSELLYGGFIEHLGRCIYGGVVDDPKNPSPKHLLIPQDTGAEYTKGRLGWRKDVLNEFKELEVPMLRWPGGWCE